MITTDDGIQAHRNQGMNRGSGQARPYMRAVIMLVAVVALGIIGMALLGSKTADADTGSFDDSQGSVRYGEAESSMKAMDYGDLWVRSLDGSPMRTLGRSAASGHEIAPPQWHADESNSGAEPVWASDLTVGRTSDGLYIFLGYWHGATAAGDMGSLESTKFSYDGVEYAVQRLFLRERKTGGIQHLVFGTDVPLRDNLILQLGDQEFAVSESRVFGYWSTIYAWSFDTDPGWNPGHTTPVALIAPSAGEDHLIQIPRVGPVG